MKILKKVGFVFIAIIGLLILGALFPNQETVIVHGIDVKESRENVYAILVQIDNVDEWNPPVHEAIFISENKYGMGAARQCTLPDGSIVQEGVTNLLENEFIEMEMIKHNMPVVFFRWKIDIKDSELGSFIEQTTTYKMKYGLLGVLLDKIAMRENMVKVFKESYHGLKQYIEERSNNQNGQKITEDERSFAIEYLTQSKKELLKILNPLTLKQINFKIDERSWSIAECVEHIAVGENGFISLVEKALKEKKKFTENKMEDDALIVFMEDRTKKTNTAQENIPTNRYGSYQNSLNEFIQKREGSLKYIGQTNDDLRNSYFQFPFANLDAYQIILMMTAHSKRHTKQIEGIIQHKDFPKK